MIEEKLENDASFVKRLEIIQQQLT